MSDTLTPIIDQIQIALFPNKFSIKEPSKMGLDLVTNEVIDNNDSYHVDSFPDSFPGDVVRVRGDLVGEDNVKLMIAPLKISLYFTNLSKSPEFNIDESVYSRILERIGTQVLKGKNFNRVGYIINIYQEFKDPAMEIQNRLLLGLGRKINTAAIKITFDSSKKIDRKHLSLNNNVVIETGRLTTSKERVILIQRDVNTKLGHSYEFQNEEVLTFIREMQKEYANATDAFNKIFNKLP